ncbi:hypothetical protein TWF696_001397 [Orbilia brochopaga]|uniref:Uncharacterized protein n=1 Tax=Orbilia brochopaga TaxID=3140254 RepID=A0AAV9U8Q3_9PEZI
MANNSSFVRSDEVAPQPTQPIGAPRPVFTTIDLLRLVQQMGGMTVTCPSDPSSSSSPSSSRSGVSSATSPIPDADGTESEISSARVFARAMQASSAGSAEAQYADFGIGPVPVFDSSDLLAPVIPVLVFPSAPAPIVPVPVPAPALHVQVQPPSAAPNPLQPLNLPAPTATYPVVMEDVRAHRTPRFTWMEYDGDVVMTPVPDLPVPKRRRLAEERRSAVLKRRQPKSKIPAAVIRMAQEEVARRRKSSP